MMAAGKILELPLIWGLLLEGLKFCFFISSAVFLAVWFFEKRMKDYRDAHSKGLKEIRDAHSKGLKEIRDAYLEGLKEIRDDYVEELKKNEQIVDSLEALTEKNRKSLLDLRKKMN